MSIATVQQTDNGSSLQRSEKEAGSVENKSLKLSYIALSTIYYLEMTIPE